MINYREILRLKKQGFSNTRVAVSCGSSRNTVAKIWKLAEEKKIGWPIPDKVTNKAIHEMLYPEAVTKEGRKMPNFEYIFNELAKPGVTLTLLWAEYCEQCVQEHILPYQHTQFNEKYKAYALSQKATLRINRKPGEIMEVDWVGNTFPVYDEMLGESLAAYLFVACLPCSLYSYVEAFPDMKSIHWIAAHVHAYQFFGGVTRIIVPDNLKTGVLKNTSNELVLNRSYQEMAEYYGTAIIPARPVHPRDKPNAENTVQTVETCEKALTYTPAPDLKIIRTMLKNGQDSVAPAANASRTSTKYGITRGAAYYRKGGECK